MKPRVLFLCTGNSCRSQMAEGFLRALAGDRFQALSAGIEARGLNPRAVASMREAGVDISAHTSKTLDRVGGGPPDIVITVCEDAAARCPTYPGVARVERWSFPDPARMQGDEEELRARFGEVRDAIRARIQDWLARETSASDGPGSGARGSCGSAC